MKIGLLGPTYPFRGGISHYTTLLFKHLKAAHDVKFISFKRQYPKILFPGKTDKDLSSTPLTEEGVEYLLDSMNPFTWARVAREFIRFQPDILIIPWWVSFWTPQFWYIASKVKKAGNTKILFLCHNVLPHETSRLNLWGRKLVLGQGDFFITHSNDEITQLEKLIPGAMAKRSFHPTYAELNTTCVEISERNFEEPYNLLFFGFVREYKGLKYLIEAIAKLQDGPEVRLTIAGEFWDDKAPYVELIKELKIEDKVTIIDRYIQNEEFAGLFNKTDLVVLPYITVTGSGALQLALGNNKPVITTNIGSLSEIVIDGFNGFGVAARDSSALAEAIKKGLKRDIYDKMVGNISNDKERFSWQRMIETIESFI